METSTNSYHIYFDAATDAVVMKWDGYATSVQFKEGTELMLTVLRQHHASKVLADTKEMVLIGREDQQWLDTNFLPRAIQSGFKVIAIVPSQHYFNKVAVESIVYKIDQSKLLVNFFATVAEAREWLAIQ